MEGELMAIVLVLQVVFGISPGQLWAQIRHLPQDLIQLVESLDVAGILEHRLSICSK